MERKCKCGSKYGLRANPERTAYLCYYCDNARRSEDELLARENERAEQIVRDIAEGRRDACTGRMTPKFED